MPEPLLGDESMVAEWDRDAGLYLVRAWLAGPAGTAGLRLRGGVEVDLDVAWPSRLAELRVPTRDGDLDDRTRRLVEPLLGRRRLSRLQSDRRSEPWPIGEVPYRERRRESQGVARGMQTTALARQAGNDARFSDLRRGVALLEAASWAQRHGGRWQPGGLQVADARLGAELLFASLARAPLALDAAAAHDFVIVLRRVATASGDDPAIAARLFALADDLDAADGKASADERAAFAAMPAMAAPAAGRREPTRLADRGPAVQVDRRTLPLAFTHTVVRAERVSMSEIDVRVVDEAVRSEGCWARAFDGTGTLLAMAPLRPLKRDGRAQLLVAPEVMDEVVVDVIDQPGRRRPSSALDAVEAAIVDGRDAARFERIGERKEAAMAWHRAAEHWNGAGDVTRSATAHEYARGRLGRRGTADPSARIPGPLVADRVTT
jgi:hypothetical protein